MSVHVIEPRELLLGGDLELTVRRTLPHRKRSFVGAWCFLDHYGPTPVGPESGMDVPPHPHTALATVSWLFEGEIQHRDSGGWAQVIRPGELNLMTAGHGIAHSEVATPETRVLHGVQLWAALPASTRDGARNFHHYAPEPVHFAGGRALVFLGSLLGSTSPVETSTPLLGAQLDLQPGARVVLDVDSTFEHAVLLDTGAVSVEDEALALGALGIVAAGPRTLTLTVGAEGARVVLLGGPPFDEESVMWWNFMGPSHEAIVQARDDWDARSDRFGEVPGDDRRIEAPPLPPGRLRPRGRTGFSRESR